MALHNPDEHGALADRPANVRRRVHQSETSGAELPDWFSRELPRAIALHLARPHRQVTHQVHAAIGRNPPVRRRGPRRRSTAQGLPWRHAPRHWDFDGTTEVPSRGDGPAHRASGSRPGRADGESVHRCSPRLARSGDTDLSAPRPGGRGPAWRINRYRPSRRGRGRRGRKAPPSPRRSRCVSCQRAAWSRPQTHCMLGRRNRSAGPGRSTPRRGRQRPVPRAEVRGCGPPGARAPSTRAGSSRHRTSSPFPRPWHWPRSRRRSCSSSRRPSRSEPDGAPCVSRSPRPGSRAPGRGRPGARSDGSRNSSRSLS